MIVHTQKSLQAYLTEDAHALAWHAGPGTHKTVRVYLQPLHPDLCVLWVSIGGHQKPLF